MFCFDSSLILELLKENLLSPFVMAFFLGIIAVYLKSDMKLPDGVYVVLSFFLLFALGLKGGSQLRETSLHKLLVPLLGTFILGCCLPFIAFFSARFSKLSQSDSAALAAHYGSVSVVTVMAALVFVERVGSPADGFMTALTAVLEIPGIIIGLLLGTVGKVSNLKSSTALNSKKSKSIAQRVKALLVSKSVFLLLGGMFIGIICGQKGLEPVKPFFFDPFKGVLVLFLLDMGILAGQRLKDIGDFKKIVLLFGICLPIINALVACFFAKCMSFSVGNMCVFACMAASASYIAAPAAVRMSLSQANPGIYLTSAIAVTFPFNLTVGIPMFYFLSLYLQKCFY